MSEKGQDNSLAPVLTPAFSREYHKVLLPN